MTMRPTSVPNLVLAQRVVDKMAAAASRFMEDETGEAMIGLRLEAEGPGSVPTVYVLDTISPDESAIRQFTMFEQGDSWQEELMWWYQDNWNIQRKMRQGSYGSAIGAKWDAPLTFLGDWHKQPGYMIKPSGGDLMTALDWLDDPESKMDALLVPIVTLGHPATTDETTASVNYVTVPMDDGSMMRVDWWYIHRDFRMFQPINPVVYSNEQLPGLTKLPWHLKIAPRTTEEFDRLQADGLAYSLLWFDIDKRLPLEICIAAWRMGSSKIYLVATYADYPDFSPIIRLVPFTSLQEGETIADVFPDWWKKSEPAEEPPGWEWTEETYLVDYIRAIEDAMGLRPDPPVVEVTDEDDDDAAEKDSDNAEADKAADESTNTETDEDADEDESESDDDESTED